ncbi:MAG: hypothetical protein HKN26_09225 [Acidimicrobiales bacterium]|nr:hypothetical protein [Acidimicrobiales bacterium]
MERLLIVAVVVALAGVVAFIANRRDPDAPVRTGYAVPDQLRRADFDRPESPWLVAVFTSATCSSCAKVWEAARHLDSDEVVVQEIEVGQRRDLHERYQIDAVPMVVITDARGTTKESFLGPPSTSELWATIAALRDAAENA